MKMKVLRKVGGEKYVIADKDEEAVQQAFIKDPWCHFCLVGLDY